MKTVYVLLKTNPDGCVSRVGTWAKRATAEKHLAQWEEWARRREFWAEGCTFTIVEEQRL